MPDEAPRLTRAVTVLPEGRIRWELDRSINGATVKAGDSLFSLYLDPQRLRELEPSQPERLTRTADESSRDFTFRERARPWSTAPP